jgi:hypothetical protein
MFLTQPLSHLNLNGSTFGNLVRIFDQDRQPSAPIGGNLRFSTLDSLRIRYADHYGRYIARVGKPSGKTAKYRNTTIVRSLDKDGQCDGIWINSWHKTTWEIPQGLSHEACVLIAESA